MDFKNLIISGNSFSQDGIGGCPPTPNTAGGCSFCGDENYKATVPKSWSSQVANKLKVTSFINTASSSHGNFLIADTILHLLTTYQYTPKNTLVIFNISMPTRLDVPCEFTNPDISKFLSWNKSLIPFAYLNRTSRVYQTIEKNIGLDIIPTMSWQKIDFLCNWLENQKYRYLFLTTENYNSEREFRQIMAPRKNLFIELDPGVGLLEWSALTENNTENNYHPDEKGRGLISDLVIEKIKTIYN
jgi:hypothetical protein